MKNLKMVNGLRELNVREQAEINGGETLWYHIGAYLGRTVRFIEDL
ncbi:MAG: hypothetical protein ACO1NS_07300 [Daejeonella sp.]|nr:hypothetical protein [Daejeonella sp. JGW-45]